MLRAAIAVTEAAGTRVPSAAPESHIGHREEGMRRRLVRGSVHERVEGGRPGGLHRKAILGCCEEGVRRRPLRGSAQGRVEGQPGGGVPATVSEA
jgi:hypothetical protein